MTTATPITDVTKARSATKKILGVVGIIVALLFATMATAVLLLERQERLDKQASPARLELQKMLATAPDTTPKAVAESRIISYEDFQQLRDGTPYGDVSKSLGRPGRQLSRSQIGDSITASYEWVNPDGSTLHLIFQSSQGGLAMKSQRGLR